jgi:hypothetical protein
MRHGGTSAVILLALLAVSPCHGQPGSLRVLKGKVLSIERGERFTIPLKGVGVRSDASGNTAVTSDTGFFQLSLKSTEVPGEEIQLSFDNSAEYGVFSPQDARLILPRNQDKVVEILMLPIGSKRWLSDDLIEADLARHRSASAERLQSEAGPGERLSTSLRE